LAKDPVKLSDAIEAGARLLGTPGPLHVVDCWTAAEAGLSGVVPDTAPVNTLYWENPWGIRPGSDLEHWLRLTVTFRYRWSDVLRRLRGYGA
jgi:hypothetical protein